MKEPYKRGERVEEILRKLVEYREEWYGKSNDLSLYGFEIHNTDFQYYIYYAIFLPYPYAIKERTFDGSLISNFTTLDNCLMAGHLIFPEESMAQAFLDMTSEMIKELKKLL